MSEHYRSHEGNHETHINESEAKRHHERLKDHHERSAKHTPEHAGHEREAARHEVQEHAVSAAEYVQPSTEQHQQHSSPISSRDKAHVFETIMHHARQGMSKPEQTFSKFIHKPVVEKTSEVLGKTVVRPSGIAGATAAAIIGLLSIYSIAKFAGFELSGSEMPFLLLIGFSVGLFTEWIFKAVRSVFSPKRD